MKSIVLNSVLAFSLLMVGCSSSSDSDGDTTSSSSNSSSSEQTHSSSSTTDVLPDIGNNTNSSTALSTSSAVAVSSATQSSSSEAVVAFALTSTDIADGEYMDVKFGATSNLSNDARGQNISPMLTWTEVVGANSYAIEMIDLDYQNSQHWAIINIPASVTTLPQNVSNTFSGMQSISNDYSEVGYTGPFPPDTHRYQITIYAVGIGTVSNLSQAKNNAIESTTITPKFKW